MSSSIDSVYAHTQPYAPPACWQTLEDHLRAVADRAAQFAGVFDSADWAWNAGWLHDIGKAAPEFQKYLRACNGLDDPRYEAIDSGGINHSSAGAALAGELFQALGLPLSYIVAGHHAGLTDYESETAGRGALTERIKEGQGHLALIRDAIGDVKPQIRRIQGFPPFVRKARDAYHLWVRMVFSSLVDADYLDTEAFMQQEQASSRGGYPSLSELKIVFDRYMEELTATADRTDVNAIRQEILCACRAAAGRSTGWHSLTVPTGGGKTLAGVAFAIDHAINHDLRRIIYVIPYTSIIEQTADVLRKIFGADNVVEHHSNLDPERETQRMRLAAENWDAPIIVTTNVQFFESLFADKPRRCRKLHNIARSVVILDEAQLLPTKRVVPCIEALQLLVQGYGVSVLLSTATQPKPPKMPQPSEIIPDPAGLYARLRRTCIRLPDRRPVSWPDLASELSHHDRVLCIVNTRGDCLALYDHLLALCPEGTFHLSALMCGEHRSRCVREIKSRLREGLPVRVVSTQLVEAGVDLDFPIVYRALAGLDSILQAAGRCNREGKLGRLGEVIVFVPPGLMRKGAATTLDLMDAGIDPESLEATVRYFELYYSRANDLGDKWLVDRLVRDVPKVPFRKAGEEFRLIDDNSIPVIVLYDGSGQWIERLRAQGPTREIMRRLQRYSVNVYGHQRDAMLRDGQLELLECGVHVQALPGLYRDDIGLDLNMNALSPVTMVW